MSLHDQTYRLLLGHLLAEGHKPGDATKQLAERMTVIALRDR